MTLTILVVVTAFLDHLFSAGYPEINREKSLYSMTLEQIDSKNQGQQSGPMSFSFVNKYIKSLKLPAKISLTSMVSTANMYRDNKKIRVFFKYTDAEFWEIHQFDFLEGKPYTTRDIDNNEFMVVINEDLRNKYFGNGVSCIGKTIDLDNQKFKIVGVVKGVPITRPHTSADIYLPYNTTKEDLKDPSYRGSFAAIVLAKEKNDLPKIRAEFAEIARKIPIVSQGGFNPDKINIRLDDYVESFLINLFRREDNSTFLYSLLVLIALIFMSLPAINLININTSRILERASEIGIRKAFGASSKVLVGQFVVENIFLTLIGGVIAIVFSLLIIFYINTSQIIPNSDLAINWKVLGVATIASLVFGLLSGVYPAWRMSKMHIVDALKA
ncbi:MAG: ABC transporter permease [Spirosomaceae bacterium]|nr:ABC transporter permease [Spirosomataceae bacterium]